MPVSFEIGGTQIVSFLLVFSRLSGLLIFLPVPGLRAIPAAIRPLVALSFSVPLAGLASHGSTEVSPGNVLLACLSEMAFGLLWGIAVHFLIEAFVLAAQFLALQAGFGYASMVDPSTQADAGLLQILLQLMASMLFFATGFHREVIHAMGISLVKVPPGTFVPSQQTAESLIALGTSMIHIAMRLALPLIALLLLVDLALALLGRIQAQLQLLTMAFPFKLLVSLLFLGMLCQSYRLVYERFGKDVLYFLAQISGAGG